MMKQHKLAKEIVAITLPEGQYLQWAKTGFVILRRHWNELDYHRTSKFMNLAQMLLDSVFRYIESKKFGKSVRKWLLTKRSLLSGILAFWRAFLTKL